LLFEGVLVFIVGDRGRLGEHPSGLLTEVIRIGRKQWSVNLVSLPANDGFEGLVETIKEFWRQFSELVTSLLQSRKGASDGLMDGGIKQAGCELRWNHPKAGSTLTCVRYGGQIGQGPITERRGCDIASQNANVIKCWRKGRDASERELLVGRFKTDNTTVMSGKPYGTSGVGAKCHLSGPNGNDDRRSSTGAAGNERGRNRIACLWNLWVRRPERVL
jgi:hypothetical protein